LPVLALHIITKEHYFCMLSEEPDEQLPRDEKHKTIARADRWLSKYERESRFLNKMSEDYKVFDDVFDMPTLLTINELRSNGMIQYIKSSLAAGKESKVYLAVAPDGSLRTVKIYLTVNAKFKKRMQYIAGDPRFSDIKRGSRSLIMAWARKEFKNMQTAHVSGVRVPLPIAVRKNVLVMEFVGDSEGNPTPALVYTEELTSADYQQVIKQMTMLYQKAKLVHADLSEYNIFKTDSGVMLFDFGSAIDIQHPNSKQFLVRDVMNINKFFEKRGIDVLNTAQVVEKIRGDTK
jgi:RIO kinase 1